MHVENHTVTSTHTEASELKNSKSCVLPYSGAVSWPNTLMRNLHSSQHRWSVSLTLSRGAVLTTYSLCVAWYTTLGQMM